MVLQKYIVDWGTKRNVTTTKGLPWYLSGDSTEAGPPPDYVVCSGNDAVPGALQVAQSYPPKQVFSGKYQAALVDPFFADIFPFCDSVPWIHKLTLYPL